MTSIEQLVDDLGEKLGGDPWIKPVEKPQPVETPVRRFSNPDVWPAEEWERMQRIWRGEE